MVADYASPNLWIVRVLVREISRDLVDRMAQIARENGPQSYTRITRTNTKSVFFLLLSATRRS